MTRTHEDVSRLPEGKPADEGQAYTRETGAVAVAQALELLGGRWKLEILFQLFGGRVRRFSDLERAIPAVSQKMLAQQLRQLERDGLVHRVVHPQVPPRVDYALTEWGQALCPVLDALLRWQAGRKVER
ncbi:helix-turn-helix transcriptional regulator [Starkeya koreensis]|uniref:Helix-turn-helix transcriptional regulator n=1 Tax=Ancylobacter koreensis TaxID=266121 RepID=A0ABT0DHZ1_9HYPH|nr:helix-turn-helix domain-containing protein [Ancylobacter koreensis]MCK0206892.1 helix-turn-helix transcriptional regulator [Ancylobacter koreensis]